MAFLVRRTWRRVFPVSVLLLLGVGLLLLTVAGEPPRPDLPLPRGISLISVEGHCVEGSELFMCESGDTLPRSTLTLRVADGDAEAGYTRLRDHVLALGWNPVNGTLCRSGEGCVSLHQLDRGQIILDWSPSDHTVCSPPSSMRLDPADCATRR